MKTPNVLKTQDGEAALSLAIIVVMLFILPPFGASAMLAGSVVGLAAYIFLFPARFRSRSGTLKAAIYLLLALAVAAAAAIAVSLIRGHWY